MLEQNTTKKERVNKNVTKLDVDNNKSDKYKVKAIYDSVVYAKESISYLPGLYYLIF